jgi:oxygen-independent coproporphyrinogen-3 oxidase
MDLIYGTPHLTQQKWHESLRKVEDIGAPHLSAYQLTIEPKTALGFHVRKGNINPPDDAETVRQFELLMEWAADAGYEHYEISNLAQPGHRAVHNSNYWKGIPYLGIGPSAHSFNGLEREWNVANNARYVKGIAEGSARDGIEVLTPDDRYNEYVMTALRTAEGVHTDQLEQLGENYFAHFTRANDRFINEGFLIQSERHWVLSKSGKVFADRIASELFITGGDP